MNRTFSIIIDALILIIAPIILYFRITELAENGFSVYPVLSALFVSAAFLFVLQDLIRNRIKSPKN